jgi:hypothetical protein
MLAVVLGSASVLAAAMPTLADWQERSSLASARKEIEMAIVTASSAAAESGRSAEVTLAQNRLTVTMASEWGGRATVIPTMRFDKVYGVRVAATDSAITFDERGVTTPRRRSTRVVYRIMGPGGLDSVCVTRRGRILGRGCAS